MGWEHDPATVFRAQELYCADRLPMREVAERVGVAESTLWRWAEKYAWAEKREEIARAAADIAADFILARSRLLKDLLETRDPMTGFAVAKLEDLALKQAQAARDGAARAEADLAPPREIKTPGEAATALEEAAWRMVAAMLTEPERMRDVAKLKEALALAGRLRAEAGDRTGRTRGLTPETARELDRILLGT